MTILQGPLDARGMTSSYEPEQMDFLLSEGSWDIFGFIPTHECHACMAPAGHLFLLCRHREAGYRLVTPCVQNGSRFELTSPSGAFHMFPHIDELFRSAEFLIDVSLLSRATLVSSARWYVDNPEMEARGAMHSQRPKPKSAPASTGLRLVSA